MKYLKQFETHKQYETLKSNLKLPNVSICKDTPNEVHYNPDTRLVAKYNVTDTSSPTQIGCGIYISGFSAIEIDGVEQPSVISAYTFSTTGEHTVKYTLTNQTSIGYNAFKNCTSLTSITIPNSVTSIETSAFYDCSGLTSITIPNSVTSIGQYAFRGCSGMTTCTIGRSVTSIGTNAFQDCRKLTTITIPSSVTSIGQYTFAYCTSITGINIPNSVTRIGQYAFSNCSGMTSVIIGSGVTTIDNNAFYRCGGMTSCTIGSGVTSIGDYAFQDCQKLKSITCDATTASTISSRTFYNVKTNGTLYVSIGSTGYDTWMQQLGQYNWTKVEQ